MTAMVVRVVIAMAAVIAVLTVLAVAAGQASNATGPAAEATTQETIEVDGRERTYWLHVGSTVLEASPAPLVLAFHGGLGTGAGMEKLTKFSELADSEGFIVAYPDGYKRSWNAGNGAGEAEAAGVDDVAFVRALIETLERDQPVDPRRIYAAGMSNGGILVHRLACELSDRIAAIAAVAGPIAPAVMAACAPARPISVLLMHGTADTFVPYDGGSTKGGGTVESAPATVQFWAKQDRCRRTPKRSELPGGSLRERHRPCAKGTEVTLYRIKGGGHTWPGGWQYLPTKIIGPTDRSVDATSEIWAYFRAFRLPSTPTLATPVSSRQGG
jgi:polyhydroxybutyrate depolymerase